jgi:hypothetical protein
MKIEPFVTELIYEVTLWVTGGARHGNCQVLYVCHHLQEGYSGAGVNSLVEDFRAKFFQYGEQQRKQRKLRKVMARETYLQAVSQMEEDEVNCRAQCEDRDDSSSERWQ